MRIKYTGGLDEVTVRGVTFPHGKGVEVDDEALAAKMLAWPDVEEVKPGRKPNAKNAQ